MDNSSKTRATNPLIKSDFSNGHLKLSIDIDCAESLESLKYDIEEYGFEGIAIQEIADVLLDEITRKVSWWAANDDHDLAHIIANYRDDTPIEPIFGTIAI